ncbi:MAG: TlpA family protein disulfide reductase, partial [Gemmatimonadota bacterium]
TNGELPDAGEAGPEGEPGPDRDLVDRWVLRTLLAAAGLVLAVGVAWYVAEGYRQAGGSGSEGAAAGDAAARAEDASGAAGMRTRRGSRGGERWLDIRAPVVTFPTLSGDTASLAAYRGRAVVLNFWATWCPPCKREIPELARLQDSIPPEKMTVVGVAVTSGSSRKEIRAFGEKHGIDYPVWLSDPGTAAREYRAVGLPLTLLVDGRGVIRRRYMGPQTYETLSRDVRALLDSASGPGGRSSAEPPSASGPSRAPAGGGSDERP